MRSDPHDFLTASGVASSDIVSITVTTNSVTVVVRSSTDAVFGNLIGNDEIVVYGTGEATATFGSPP